jgi:hypothetical protein
MSTQLAPHPQWPADQLNPENTNPTLKPGGLDNRGSPYQPSRGVLEVINQTVRSRRVSLHRKSLRANAVIPRREGYPSRHAGRSVFVMGIYNTSSAGTIRPGIPYKYMPLRSRRPRSRRSTVGRSLQAITRIRPSRRVFHQAAPLLSLGGSDWHECDGRGRSWTPGGCALSGHRLRSH